MKAIYLIFLLNYFSATTTNPAFTPNTRPFSTQLSEAALAIINPNIKYDPTYCSIKYPNGDVPKNKGVCTDVVIRAYRKLNIDLQKEVHEDMKANFSKYPNLKKWGMKKTDTNIDHRRVPNLEVFFERKGKKLLVTDSAKDYKTGDIVTWMINGKLPHIGIVTHKKTSDGLRPLIVHNVGYGQVLEDCLFKYKIVGHFQYTSTISFLAQVEQWSITVRCLASVADNVNVNRINKHLKRCQQ